MSFGRVILSYGDSLLRESEIQILKTSQWLNDTIINFYFEHLSKQCPSDNIVFYGPAVTQLLKLLPNSDEVKCVLGEFPASAQYGMWAVNDSSDVEKGSSGSHWSLLVFSRPDSKFLHFDSWNGCNEDAAIKLSVKLKPCISPNSSFHSFKQCCPQINGRDCGLHVLGNAQLIKDFIETKKETPGPILLNSGLTTANPKYAENMRGKLLKLILSLSKDT